MSTDALIRERLADRLESCRTRQEKSRLVASIMYYDLDLGFPSAATVRQYTQHGSLNDIQRDLKDFQSEVKDRERIHLDLPGMPETLNAAFVESAKQTWMLANQEADQRFEAHREAVQIDIEQAKRAADEAQHLLSIAEIRADEAAQRLDTEREMRIEAEKRAEALSGELDAMKSSIAYLQRQLAESEQARRDAEAQFSRDLEAEREARKRDAEMLEGDIRFAKMQIHEAREHAAMLKDELRAAKAERNIEVERYRQRANHAEQQLGEARLNLQEKTAELNRLSAFRVKPKVSRSSPGRKRAVARRLREK